MTKTVKLKLLIYLLVSAVSFPILILPGNAGVSVPVFMCIQFVCMCFLAPEKKPLLTFVPLFILAFNSFISANHIWRLSNFVVSVVFYSVMTLWMTGRFSVKGSLTGFLFKTLANITKPFFHFTKPILWCAESHKTHMRTITRVVIGICISIPCLIFLFIMLSSADEIFSHAVSNTLLRIVMYIRPDAAVKALAGILAGFYLFGLLYNVYVVEFGNTEVTGQKTRKGDLIILNIVHVSILLIYTLFVIIQFKYLFASAGNLPYGLTFVTYARRGFFELMFLTGVNIAFILLTVWLTKDQSGGGAKLTKILSLYLCAVTVVLLVSSFYRMWLYNYDDGLTRLRFLVFGFLIFQAIGLAATFIYIIKPRFNILAIYCAIAVTYYLLLNVVPMDAIVARSQINRYFETGRGGIDYVLTLSPDAGPQIARLLESNDANTIARARAYYETKDSSLSGAYRWRQWNLSIDRLLRYVN